MKQDFDIWNRSECVTACLGKLIVCSECMHTCNSIQGSPTLCLKMFADYPPMFRDRCVSIHSEACEILAEKSSIWSWWSGQGVIVIWVLFQERYYIAKLKKVRMTALVVLVLSFGCWCAYDNKPAWNSVEIHSGLGWHIVNNYVFFFYIITHFILRNEACLWLTLFSDTWLVPPWFT